MCVCVCVCVCIYLARLEVVDGAGGVVEHVVHAAEVGEHHQLRGAMALLF